MDERLDGYLDGEPGAAKPSERERRDAAALGRATTELRRALAPARPEELEARILAAVEAEPLMAAPSVRSAREGSSFLRRWGAALLQTRELRLRWRPVHLLGAAAAAALLLPLLPWGGAAPDGGPLTQEGVAPPATVFVQFRLQVDAASSVALAGSFTGWQPTHTLQQAGDGVWTAVVPVTPGVHDYVFVVDGARWVADPYAPQVDDGFGGTNSRLTLLAPAAL